MDPTVETSYQGIDGIFFDEIEDSDQFSYSQLRSQHTRNQYAAAVVFNALTDTNEAYLSLCDVLVIHENFGSEWLNDTQAAWSLNYDPSRLGTLVHTVNPNAWERSLQLAIERNYGHVFLTD